MKKIILILLTLSLTLVFTTGCWDMKEINERIFPYSVGLDLIDQEDLEGGRYEISFTYPNINALGSQAIQEDIVYLSSVRGNSIFEGATNITGRLQKPMYLRDLKVVIFPETLAQDKELMKEIIDGLRRDYIVNKVMEFVVVKSTAKELLEVKVASKKQVSIEGLLYELLKNSQGSTSFIPSTLIGFVSDMNTSKASIVPIARTEDLDIVVDSSAVFKDYEIVGYLDKMDSRNIAMLTNKIKNFGINTLYKGTDIALKIPRSRTKIRLVKSEEGLKLKYTVKIEGQIEQFTSGKEHELEDENTLKDIEKTLEKDVKTSIEGTVKKLQSTFNTDLIGTANYLYKFKPSIWKEIKDSYDEVFPDIDIDVDVEVFIRRRGLIK